MGGTMAMKINGYKIIMTSMGVIAVILQIFFHLNPIASIIIKVLLGVVIFSAISRIILDNKNNRCFIFRIVFETATVDYRSHNVYSSKKG